MSKRCEIGKECPRHAGVEHGGEAEELRAAFEKLQDVYASRQGDDATMDASDVAEEISRTLDRIDARDSLAWREYRDRRAARSPKDPTP